MLCVTGLPLVFGEEIAYWLGTTVEPPELETGAPRSNLDAIVEDARARRPREHIQFVFQDEEAPAWFVLMGVTPDALENSAVYKYDGRTGALLQDVPLRQGFMHVMLKLHVDLFADLPGTLFLGCMGLLFVLSIVSGAVIYGPFMRKLPFGTIRQEGSRRLTWLDLHNLLGIVTLSWVVVVGATGVVNTLARPIFGQWQNTELADMTAASRGKPRLAHISSFDQAVKTAERIEPEQEVGFVAFPETLFAGPHHYAIFMRGKTPLTAKLSTPILIDGETGAITATRNMPWYVTALSLSQPLHFGDYGGTPLKIVWALLDLITIIVLGSGLYLWWKNRKVSAEQLMPETDAAHEIAVAFAGEAMPR
jgi:uncharacterized iron-regulated membrane protein